MKRTSKQYLKDILDCIKKIEDYTKNVSPTKFERRDELIDAVIRRFEIIGEATK